jgi:hypothetical protein
MGVEWNGEEEKSIDTKINFSSSFDGVVVVVA